MTHTTLPAVDELADLRRTLAGLRLRELELCDEIRASAGEIGATLIAGDTRMAMIETRKPRQLDMSKLPNEILNNPDMFNATPQTHVLLWPKTNVAALDVMDDTPMAAEDTSALETISEAPQMSAPEMPPADAEMRIDVTAPAFDEADAPELADNNDTDSTANVIEPADNMQPGMKLDLGDTDATLDAPAIDADISLDIPEPPVPEATLDLSHDMADLGDDIPAPETDISPSDITEDMPDAMEFDHETLIPDADTNSIETTDTLTADLADTDGMLDAEAFDADMTLDISEATFTEDTLDLSSDMIAPEADMSSLDITADISFGSNTQITEATENESPVFDTTGADAPLPALDMPSLDAHDIASTAEEIPSPSDLLATQYTDLQPMGDLTEEDLDAAIYAAEQGLPPVVDPDAVLSTEALQAEFDTLVENPAPLETEGPAPFVTRRIIGVPA
jgi:hypothetical protein